MKAAFCALLLLAAGPSAAPEAEAGPDPVPAAVAVPPPREAPAFSARGVGRRWELAIDERRIIFSMPTAAGWRVVARPEPVRTAGGLSYRTPYLQVDIVARPCRIGPATYSDSVTFAVDGGVFTGCGGARVGKAGIADTPWEVVAVNDEPAPHDRFPIVLRFAPGRPLGGSVSCNDFGVDAIFDGQGFRGGDPAGHAVMTGVGCPDDEGDALFRRLVPLLQRLRSWRIDGDTLLLKTAGGNRIRLKRLI